MTKPNPTRGIRHVALHVKNYDAMRHFYVDVVGMRIDWEPDSDNLYLTSGFDNLALHRAPADFSPAQHQHLDHSGYALQAQDDVEAWHSYLVSHDVEIKAAPKAHRDGTTSFYCADPDGNVVQFIHIPYLEKN